MKILFIMGGSGTGKTTLAKKLEKISPEQYYRVRELSTREIRNDEIDGFDYKFVSDERFQEMLENGELFECVEKQFPPYKYGGEFSELKDDKTNIVVASIEGFLSGLRGVNEIDSYDEFYSEHIVTKNILLNIINDDILDVEREGRDPKLEENFNLGVLNVLKCNENLIMFENIFSAYYEIKLSELKKIRDDDEKLLSFFSEIIRDL